MKLKERAEVAASATSCIDTPPATENPSTKTSTPERRGGISRRTFLGTSVAGLAAAGTVGMAGIFTPVRRARADLIGPLIGQDRLIEAEAVRQLLIDLMVNDGIPSQVCNGDEQTYSDLRATFAKGLSHNFTTGLPDPSNYAQLRSALDSGVPADFENISLAGTRLLVNPQAGLAFDTEGNDPHQFAMEPAPAFSSEEAAAEMIELYWMALLRDIRFTQYDSSLQPFIGPRTAASELTSLGSAFTGPKVNGRVTTRTLFRDKLPGALDGPYISQFMYLDTPFGTEQVDRMMRTVVAGSDYMTTYNDWFEVQEGRLPLASQDPVDPVRRYIRNGRDLAEWVHIDVLFQAYFNACLILGTPMADGGIGAPLNPGNPYLNSLTQEGFGTWGGPAIKTLLCEVATRALKAVWFQKWFVHRRLRPETFGGRVHVHLNGIHSFDIDSSLLNSTAVAETFSEFSSYLLPMAFPEGSPIHPSYGAGHATVAGACVTVLKALFDETHPLDPPYYVASTDGTSLVPWNGSASLTVGGELNKLASNIATGRAHAGVHYRSDNIESLKLGEEIAIKVLRDHATLFNEGGGYEFTKFDNTPCTIP